MKLSRTKIARLLKINNQSRKNIKKNKGKQQHMRAHPQQRFSKSLTNDDLILDLNTAPRKVHRSVNNLRQKQRQPNLRYQTLRRLKRRNQPLYNQEGGIKITDDDKNKLNDIIEGLKTSLASTQYTKDEIKKYFTDKYADLDAIYNKYKIKAATPGDDKQIDILADYTSEKNLSQFLENYKEGSIEFTEKIYNPFTRVTSGASMPTESAETPEGLGVVDDPTASQTVVVDAPVVEKESAGVSEEKCKSKDINVPTTIDDCKNVRANNEYRLNFSGSRNKDCSADAADKLAKYTALYEKQCNGGSVTTPSDETLPLTAPTGPGSTDPVTSTPPPTTELTVTVYNYLGEKGDPVPLKVANGKITGESRDTDPLLVNIVGKIRANVMECNKNYSSYERNITAVIFINGEKQSKTILEIDDLKTKLNELLTASPTLKKITINVRSIEYVFFKELLYGKLYYLIDVQYIRNLVAYLLAEPQFKDLIQLKPSVKGSEDKAALWKGKEEEEFYGGKALVNGGGNDSQALVKYRGSGGGYFNFKDAAERNDDYKYVGFPNPAFLPEKTSGMDKFKLSFLGVKDNIFKAEQTVVGKEGTKVFKEAVDNMNAVIEVIQAEQSVLNKQATTAAAVIAQAKMKKERIKIAEKLRLVEEKKEAAETKLLVATQNAEAKKAALETAIQNKENKEQINTLQAAAKTAEAAAKTAEAAAKTAEEATKTAQEAKTKAEAATKTAEAATKTAEAATKTAEEERNKQQNKFTKSMEEKLNLMKDLAEKTKKLNELAEINKNTEKTFQRMNELYAELEKSKTTEESDRIAEEIGKFRDELEKQENTKKELAEYAKNLAELEQGFARTESDKKNEYAALNSKELQEYIANNRQAIIDDWKRVKYGDDDDSLLNPDPSDADFNSFAEEKFKQQQIKKTNETAILFGGGYTGTIEKIEKGMKDLTALKKEVDTKAKIMDDIKAMDVKQNNPGSTYLSLIGAIAARNQKKYKGESDNDAAIEKKKKQLYDKLESENKPLKNAVKEWNEAQKKHLTKHFEVYNLIQTGRGELHTAKTEKGDLKAAALLATFDKYDKQLKSLNLVNTVTESNEQATKGAYENVTADPAADLNAKTKARTLLQNVMMSGQEPSNLKDILTIKYFLNYICYKYLDPVTGNAIVNQLENKNILQKLNYFYQNIGLGDFSHSFGTWEPTNAITKMLTVFRRNNKVTEIKAGDQDKLGEYKTYFQHIVERYAKNQQMLYGGGERKNSLLFELGEVVNNENYIKDLVKTMELQLSKYRGKMFDENAKAIVVNPTPKPETTYDILEALSASYKSLVGQDIESVYAKIQNKDARTNKNEIILFDFLNTDRNIDKIRDIIAGITRTMIEIAIAYERELKRAGMNIVSSATLAEQRKAREAAAALAKQQRLEEARKRSGDGSGTGMSNEGMALIVQLRERVKLLEDKEKEAIEKAAKASISAMMGDAEALGQNFRFDVFYPENNPFFKLSGPNGRSFENEIRNVTLDTMKGQLKSLKAEITDIYKLEYSEIQNVAQSYKALKTLNDTFATPPAGQTADDKYKVAQDISAKAKDFKLVLEALEAKMKKSEAEAASLRDTASGIGKDKPPPVDEKDALKKAQDDAKAAEGESSAKSSGDGAKSSGGGPIRGGAPEDVSAIKAKIESLDATNSKKFAEDIKSNIDKSTQDELTEISKAITGAKASKAPFIITMLDGVLAQIEEKKKTSGAAPAGPGTAPAVAATVAATESGPAATSTAPTTAAPTTAAPTTAPPTKDLAADFITRIDSITETNLLTESLKAEIEKLIAEGTDKYTAEEIKKMSEAVKNNKKITEQLNADLIKKINALKPKASGAAAPVVAEPEKAPVVAAPAKTTASDAATTTADKAKDEKLEKAVTAVKSASEKVTESANKATDDLQKAISEAGNTLIKFGNIEIKKAAAATTFAKEETDRRDIALKAEMRKKDEEEAKKKKDAEAAKKGADAAKKGPDAAAPGTAVPEAAGTGEVKPGDKEAAPGTAGPEAAVPGTGDKAAVSGPAAPGAVTAAKDTKGKKGGGKRILKGGNLEKVTGKTEGAPAEVGTESSSDLTPTLNLETGQVEPPKSEENTPEQVGTETSTDPTEKLNLKTGEVGTEAQVVPEALTTKTPEVASPETTTEITEASTVSSTEAAGTEAAGTGTEEASATAAAKAPTTEEVGSGNPELDAVLEKAKAALERESTAGGQHNNKNKKKRYTVKRKSRKTKNHKKPKGGSKKKKNKSMKPRSKKRQF